MSWNQIEGQWKQRRGNAMHHCWRMTKDKLATIAEKYEEHVGRLQEKYGMVKEKTWGQAEEFKRVDEQLRTSNNKRIGAQKALTEKEKADREHAKF